MARPSRLYFDFNSALKHVEGDGNLSASAIAALTGASRRDVAAFAETWVELPVERRRKIAHMLVEQAEENIELDYNLLFRYLLNDEDPQVRSLAIDGLWEDEDPALVRPLIGFMRSDPNAGVRGTAADSLGRFMLLAEYGRLPQSPHADLIYAALIATVHGIAEDLEVRCRALEALAYSSRDRVRDIIAAAYDVEDERMRASAIAAMGRSADKYWRKAAAGELESLSPRLRFEAARAVGELEDRSAVPRLIELLQDPDREVQMASVTSLGQIGGTAAKAALTAAVSSDDDDVLRELADEALQELRFASDPNVLLFDVDLDEESIEDDEYAE